MSIRVEKSLPNMIREAYVSDEAKSRQINLSDRIDFDTGFALASILIIWGGFILTFWSLV